MSHCSCLHIHYQQRQAGPADRDLMQLWVNPVRLALLQG